MSTDRLIKHLDVELTHDEYKLRGREHGAVCDSLDELEAEKKRHAEEYKEQLGKIEARQGELRRILRAGAEKRPIECAIDHDYARGQHVIYRTDKPREDKDAIVEKIAMTSEERQVALPIDIAEAKKKSGPKGKLEDVSAPVDPNAPPALPGKACEGCGNCDGHHHPDCTVDRGEPEDAGDVLRNPGGGVTLDSHGFVGAEVKADGTLVQHLQIPTPAPKNRVGKGSDGKRYPITEEEAARCLAGKTVVVDVDDCISVDIVGVEKLEPVVYEVTEDDDADLEDGDAGPDEDDYAESAALAEAAEIAAQQLASGETPEVAADAALAEKAAEDKKRARKRGQPKGV